MKMTTTEKLPNGEQVLVEWRVFNGIHAKGMATDSNSLKHKFRCELKLDESTIKYDSPVIEQISRKF